MRKIFVVGASKGYANWMEGEVIDDLSKADLVVFTGGEDVNPKYYQSRVHPTTSFNNFRDIREREAFQEARRRNKKLIGICRGAQFLCVMAGGSLVQHQQHPYMHDVTTMEGVKTVNSTHHQRQYPWGNKKPRFELIAWSNISPFSEGQSRLENLGGKPEVEIARYPDINALAIQPHPEMAYPARAEWHEEFVSYCRQLLNNHMSK